MRKLLLVQRSLLFRHFGIISGDTVITTYLKVSLYYSVWVYSQNSQLLNIDHIGILVIELIGVRPVFHEYAEKHAETQIMMELISARGNTSMETTLIICSGSNF